MKYWIVVILIFSCGLNAAHAQLHEIARLKILLEGASQEKEKADLYARLGMLYTNRNLDSTYYYASKSLQLAGAIDDGRVSRAKALNVLAFYHMEKGQALLAYRFVNEALSIFQQAGMKEQVCELTMNLGVMLLKEGKIDQALTKYELANQKSLQLENDSVRALILINMAYPLSRKLPYHEIEKLYEEAFRIATKYQNERALLAIRQSRNYLGSIKGTDIRRIRNVQKEIIKEALEKGYEYLAAGSYMELGNMFLAEHIDSAVFYYEKGIQLTDTTGYDVLKYILIGQAYDALKSRHPISPKVAEYSAMLLEMTKRRNMEAQAEGFSLLEVVIREKEFEIQQANLRIRQLWVVGLTIVGLLAILFGLLAYRQYRIKRKLAKDLASINARLHLQNKQLEDNNEFHKKLISMLSHDLRQPFSTIIMMSHDIFDQLDERQRKAIFDEIRQSAEISLQTVDGMLYWMKLQMLGLADNPTAVSVRENMEQALAFNRSLIHRYNIEVMVDIDESIAVLVQPEIMLFVNRNLIHNAVKHSPQGHPIRISARLEPQGSVLVRISDTGAGIPADVLPGLFRKSQLETASKQGGLPDRQKGAGLALVVCHEMIEAMGGNIWAENNQKGPGASFLYRLPPADPAHMDETRYARPGENP